MITVKEHEPLAPHTTFKLGGPARFFVSVHTLEELREALAFAQDLPAQAGKKLPIFILGGGSNVLVSDLGFDGLVIHIQTKGTVFEKTGNTTLVVAEAGEGWDELVATVVEKNLWGLENLSGIPGTIGGAVVQNIGAYGAALSQTLQWVEILDATTGEIRRMTKKECAFEYRDSFFKHHLDHVIILRAAFELSLSDSPDISYKDLAEKFAGTSPALGDIRDAVRAIRKNKFPDLAVEGTAGSFFKNPVVLVADAEALTQTYPGLPTFPLPESVGVKIPLAWFLDYRHGVLDMREVKVGGARCFEKQPLVIVADRNATADDVQKLAQLIQEKIYTACHISIEPEVKIISAKIK